MSDPREIPPALALLLCPAAAAVAGLVFPSLSLTSEGASLAVAFVGGAGSALAALALAARDATLRVPALLVGLLAVGAAAVSGSSGMLAVVLVDLGLVAAAHGLGGAVGRRVAHPGHLLPACTVAAAADVASVIHPQGLSRAIASSERALSLLAIAFPLPGARAVAPVLGVGDLAFVALALAAAVVHGASVARVVVAAGLGVIVAGVLAAMLGREVPALLPIGVAIVALVPEFRRVRREDRRTTQIAVGGALAVVVGVLVSQR